jgi:hypothetical protein
VRSADRVPLTRVPAAFLRVILDNDPPRTDAVTGTTGFTPVALADVLSSTSAAAGGVGVGLAVAPAVGCDPAAAPPDGFGEHPASTNAPAVSRAPAVTAGRRLPTTVHLPADATPWVAMV